MTPIERQILRNQIVIMQNIFFNKNEDLGITIEETRELLNPKVLGESCCDMSEDAKRGRGE